MSKIAVLVTSTSGYYRRMPWVRNIGAFREYLPVSRLKKFSCSKTPMGSKKLLKVVRSEEQTKCLNDCPAVKLSKAETIIDTK